MLKSIALIGLLITSVTVGISVYIFLASDIIRGDVYNLYATVDNATGLLIDTNVRVAGIQVGRIKNMELVENRAKLTLELEQRIQVHSNDILKRVPQGILGSSFLEIVLTNEGSVLEDGAEMLNIEDKSLIDTLSGGAEEIVGNVENVTADIQAYLATSDLFAQIDKIASTLESTLQHINQITKGLAVNSELNAQNINLLVASMAGIASALEQFLAQDKANPNQDLSDTLVSIKESLQNIQAITDSINNGEGTVGKLLKDDSLYTEANTAVANINKITNRAAGLYTNFDYRYEGLISGAGNGYASRNHINLRIAPAESPRYYQIGVSTGGPERFDGTPIYTSTIGDSTLKLNILLAQQFTPWLRAKGGLIENTGGVGIDITPIKQVEVGVEAFDFGGGDTGAMLRTTTYIYPFFDPNEKNNPLKWIYVGGGVDDILNSYERNYYFGVGIRIYDEFLYDSIRLIPLASAASSVR